MSEIKFSTYFSLGGFEVVANKTEWGMAVCRDFSYFFRKKAQLEEEFGKQLSVLCKQLPNSSQSLFSKSPPALEKEATTLKAAFLGMQEASSKMATQHLEFAAKIISNICQPIDTFVKTKENEKKTLLNTGQKYTKLFKDAQLNAVKAREQYVKYFKECEECKEAYAKALSESNSAVDQKKAKLQIDKLKERQQLAEKKVEFSVKAYDDAVEKANNTSNIYFNTQLPQLLDQYQELEESRFFTLSAALKCYATIQETCSTTQVEQANLMALSIASANLSNDLKEFVDAFKDSTKRPPLILFHLEKGKDAPKEEKEVKKENEEMEKATENQNMMKEFEKEEKQEEDKKKEEAKKNLDEEVQRKKEELQKRKEQERREKEEREQEEKEQARKTEEDLFNSTTETKSQRQQKATEKKEVLKNLFGDDQL